MSATEDRLRDAFQADADTIRPETVRALGTARDTGPIRFDGPGERRPPGRVRRVGFPVAAAAAVTGIVVLAAVLIPRALSQRPAHAAGPAAGRTGGAAAHRTTGVSALPYPAFFVAAIASNRISGFGSSLEVRSAATGALVTRIRPPHGLTFESVSTGNGQTFVAQAAKFGVCRTWLFQFRLGTNGRPGPLTPFAGGSVRASILSAVALSANDHVMAYPAQSCSNAKRPLAYIQVTNLVTGHATRWTYPSQQNVHWISLSASGSRLAYDVDLNNLSPSLAAVVPTSAPAGPLAARSHIIETGKQFAPSTDIAAAVLSPDGGTLYTLTNLTGAALVHHLTMQLHATGVRTGARQHAQVFPGVALGLWTPPAGGWLLVQAGLGHSFSTPRLDRLNEHGGEVHQLQAGWLGSDQAASIAW